MNKTQFSDNKGATSFRFTNTTNREHNFYEERDERTAACKK